MADRLPSLHLLLAVVEAERDKQLSHFDAVDTLVEFVNEGSDLLEEKSRRPTWDLNLLVTAAATFAAGIVAHG